MIKKDYSTYIEEAHSSNQSYFESGLRNINDLAGQYTKAVIYFHEDLDGVTSAIAMKQYLNQYNIKVIRAIKIQYGEKEYSIPKSSDDLLNVLVDFANGKYMMKIHTDHHDRQLGANQTPATAFVKAPSNVENISTIISPTNIFSPEDISLISTVDSADYARQGITPEDVIQSVFKLDKEKPLKINKQNQGFVVNKLLLSYKNKPNFLETVVMESQPSLHSMYINVLKIFKEQYPNEKGGQGTERGSQTYEQQQKSLIAGNQRPEAVMNLGNLKPHGKGFTVGGRPKLGQSMMTGFTLVQYGASSMFKGQKYDRYVAFKQNPYAHYFCMIWPMGLIQLSKNPFMKGNNPVPLGELVLGKGEGYKRTGGVIDKFKSQLENTFVSLYDIKKELESGIKNNELTSELLKSGKISESDAVGFTADDFGNVFKGTRKMGIQKDPEWKKMMRAITDTKMHNLEEKSKDFEAEMHSRTFTPKARKFGETVRPFKKLTVQDVYPQADEVVAGGDPAKVLAIDVLKKVKIPLWDIIMVNSGGHKDITNLSGLQYYKYSSQYKNDYENFIKKIAMAIVEKTKDMKLEPSVETNESFEDYVRVMSQGEF